MAFSRFTPENLPAIVKWGVVALINYWLLINLLHLLISVMKWVLWVVKTLFLVLLFILIATDKNASTDTTATRLFGLVLGCVFLTLACEKSYSVNRQLSSLEARLKAIEKKKTE